jgi:hypothetical protein
MTKVQIELARGGQDGPVGDANFPRRGYQLKSGCIQASGS